MVHELNLQRPKGVPKDDPIGYPLGAGLYVDRLPAGGALGADAREGLGCVCEEKRT